MTALVLTTNPGIEDVVVTELTEACAAAGVGLLGARPGYRDRQGVVSAELEATPAQAQDVAMTLRSVHHVLRPLAQFPLDGTDPLGDIRRRLGAIPVAELTPGASFRITGTRRGEHDFTSIDVQRAAGAGVIDRSGSPVSMKAFDVEIRVEVEDERCDVSVQLTRKALSWRARRPYRARIALRANVAYAMLRLTLNGCPPPTRLLDPFCGSATILLEAAARFPGIRLDGVEMFPRPAAGARKNMDAFGLSEQATIHEADGRRLRVLFPGQEGAFDAIVTNPPFGVRLGAQLDFDIFFDGLLTDAAYLLRDGGRLAVLVWHRGPFNRAMRRRGREMESVHVRIVETGNIFPGLFILQRKPRG